MSAGAEPVVAIFVPTFNDAIDLGPCLESLRAQDYPRERVEVVVWDNASQDDTQALVATKFAAMERDGFRRLLVHHSERNEGGYIPYNHAVPALAPEVDYVLGIDADVELAPDTLRRLVDAARRHGAGVVGARSVYFDRPTITAHAAGFVNRWTVRYGHLDADEPVACDYVIGCCWLLGRRVFERVGRFDPAFFMNHWEVDYCLRVRTAGHPVIYEPRAVARHKIAPGGTRGDRLYYIYRNKLIMVRRNRYFVHPRLALATCAALSLARILGDAPFRAPVTETAASLRGLWDGLLNRCGALAAT